MAAKSGHNGILKLGGNAIAKVQNWEVNLANDPLEVTYMGQGWKERVRGEANDWSGNFQLVYEPTDTAGQGSITIDGQYTAEFYNDGDGTGATYDSGSIMITSIGKPQASGDVITRSVSFSGNGTYTEDLTVA